MTSRFIVGSFVAASVVAAFACTSSNNNDGGGGSAANCAASLSGSANSACGTCLQSKCASALSDAESGCSDFFGCVCPGGTLNESLASQCEAKAEESSCTSATQALSSCESTSCSSDCGGGSSSSSSGGASSSSSGSSGTSSGSSGSNTTPVVSCTIDQGTACYLLPVTSLVSSSTEQLNCTANLAGTVVSTCPTASLVGCCLDFQSTPAQYDCFYSGTESSNASSCQSGSWVTSLPPGDPTADLN